MTLFLKIDSDNVRSNSELIDLVLYDYINDFFILL